MIKIKFLRLKNFCGYKKELIIDFTNDNSNPKNLNIFYGPNGTGKSSLLSAVHVLSNSYIYNNRSREDFKRIFQKQTYHKDYDPTYVNLKNNNEKELEIEAVFDDHGEDKSVFITTTEVVVNELPEKEDFPKDYAYFIDADSPLKVNKFQLSDDYKEPFLEMAEICYGYKCELLNDVEEVVRGENGEVLFDEDGNKIIESFYQDLVIIKEDGTRVHYKRMSAGEKKIGTLLKYLFNPTYINNTDIIIIDNIAMHIYFKRHANLIDKIIEYFPDKQFIVTTHSSDMINHVKNKYGSEFLYDLESLKNSFVKI